MIRNSALAHDQLIQTSWKEWKDSHYEQDSKHNFTNHLFCRQNVYKLYLSLGQAYNISFLRKILSVYSENLSIFDITIDYQFNLRGYLRGLNEKKEETF